MIGHKYPLSTWRIPLTRALTFFPKRDVRNQSFIFGWRNTRWTWLSLSYCSVHFLLLVPFWNQIRGKSLVTVALHFCGMKESLVNHSLLVHTYYPLGILRILHPEVIITSTSDVYLWSNLPNRTRKLDYLVLLVIVIKSTDLVGYSRLIEYHWQEDSVAVLLIAYFSLCESHVASPWLHEWWLARCMFHILLGNFDLREELDTFKLPLFTQDLAKGNSLS